MSSSPVITPNEASSKAPKQAILSPRLPDLSDDKTSSTTPLSGWSGQWSGLLGSSLSLAIAEACQQIDYPLLVLCPNVHTAQQLQHEVEFALADGSPAAKNLATRAGNDENSRKPASDSPSTSTEVLYFPDWETLPYDHFSPQQTLVAERLRCLHRLTQLKRGVIFAALPTLMYRLMPQQHLLQHSFVLRTGDTINLENLREQLIQAAYCYTPQVTQPGEFAVRGAIIDIFPAGSALPFRIERFDDEVDTIRTFDPDSQRSLDTIDAINLLPAREFPLTDEAIARFRSQWRDKFTGNPLQSPIYENITQGLVSAGIEAYLPLFYENTNCFFNYLQANTLIIKLPGLGQAADRFWLEIQDRYTQHNIDVTRPLLSPSELFVPPNDLFSALKSFAELTVLPHVDTRADRHSHKDQSFSVKALPNLQADTTAKRPLQILADHLASTDAQQRLLCVDSPGRQSLLLDLLKDSAIPATACAAWPNDLSCLSDLSHTTLHVLVSPFAEGFELSAPHPPLTVITENELFGANERRTARKRQQHHQLDPETLVRSLAELQLNAPIVHIDHGVGRYRGLVTLPMGDLENEFLLLEYAGEDKLYVPVTSLHLISRYSGNDAEHAPWHKLGTSDWQKAKRKASEKIHDAATELLALYAKRAARQGHAFPKPDEAYHLFAQAFPYEETYDQERAIDEVLSDLCSTKPMDRLICGDVGFGKTEVAMRAAFITAYHGKQVAVLVPTTLLAQQHFDTFSDRFAGTPIRIGLLSRFRTAKQQQHTLMQLEKGQIDLVIGTHKLLNKDLKFANVGLLIIDEEHRFGVRQKERLKSLRAEVDVLTLTATPIPRTLNLSMAAIRDLSLIATPPERRLPIKTFVSPYRSSLIREAILRETMRGGQVYFLHNKVANIETMARTLETLVPEVKIAIAHGQLHERELEQIMVDFHHQRFQVLLCTTIIETGIDIPSANTIIMNRADKFGLAQLHQLRGRVGRSHHQAYAYLLTPEAGAGKITKDAEKRLDAIAQYEDLGSGFMIATHDLEIRGAGELLGEEQSGHINTIGFNLYMELLERTVKAMQAGKPLAGDLTAPPSHVEIDLKLTALIPDTYLPDVHTRLVLYKRIASAESSDDLHDLQVEMVDRFGLLPEVSKTLFAQTELKLRADALGITRLALGPTGGRIEFCEQPTVDPAKLIKLMQQQPRHYRLDGPQALRITLPLEAKEKRLAFANKLLSELS